MEKLLLKLFKENNVTYNELLTLINHLDHSHQELLYKYARETKERTYGKAVFMRGLIEFSNHCRRNCMYCGLRMDNKKVSRYRLSQEEIIKCCREGYALGYRTFVLQSGEDLYYDDETLCRIVKTIKEDFKDIALTLSIGERSRETYKRLFHAGVDRFLLRHETASTKLYEKLHPNMRFASRKRCLEELKEIGYQVGAGFMVGLPEQRNEDLVKDLLFLKKLHPHMVGIGPFIPHSDTPVGGEEGGTVEKTLMMLALTRLLLPDVLLPATTAMGSLDPVGREKALKAGANVVMPNLSPVNLREKYEIYEGKICTGDESAHCRKCIEKRINKAGFEVDLSKGDHINWEGLKNDY